LLAKRIIPCLDVTGGRVVKGVNFVELRDAGDPVEIAARYNEQGADELTAPSDDGPPCRRAEEAAGRDGGSSICPAAHNHLLNTSGTGAADATRLTDDCCTTIRGGASVATCATAGAISTAAAGEGRGRTTCIACAAIAASTCTSSDSATGS
jgi:hypothetical protein